MSEIMSKVRRWSRTIHRDLSYIFAGVMLVYAASGFMLNHKNDFNSNYDISRKTVYIDLSAMPEEITNEYAISLLPQFGEEGAFKAVFDEDDEHFKIFLNGGSSIVVNRTTCEAVYESIKKRPVLAAINHLHYNPSRWWTIFSDIFLVSLVIIVLTGLVMVKGKNGLAGRGGVELAIGIIIPILFMLL